MARIGLAFRAFFRILGNRAFAGQVDALVHGTALPAPAVPTPPRPAPPAEPAKPEVRLPARSDALSLLAVLQREARLIDFFKEPLGAYADAQIGAAVRDIHRDSAAVLDRLFAITPLRDQPEGAEIEVPEGFDAARISLTGSVAGKPPYRGRLRHAGWQATKCQIPEWTGGGEAATVIALAEIEVS